MGVGARRADISGTPLSGGAYLFDVQPHDQGGGLEPQMAAILTGFDVDDTHLGHSMDVTVVGDEVLWLVGAERGPGAPGGVDLGGAYLLRVNPVPNQVP